MKNKLEATPGQFEQLVQLKLLEQKHKDPKPPSFSDLWSKADRAVRELVDTFPDQYWEQAIKTTHVPILIPRRKEKTNALLKLLRQKGVIITGSGNIRKTIGDEGSVVFNKEAEAAYKKFRKEQFEIRCLKIEGAKLNRDLAEFASLPPLRTKTAKILMPWLVEAFLDTHNGEPEESPELLDIVEDRVDESSPKKSNVPPSPKDYRNEIKKDFRKAVRLLAKEMTTLLGD